MPVMRRKLLAAFVALGFVSLFADTTYEGARSVAGAYLNFLAAPAIAAGILALGELLSYLMRLVGGVMAQRASSGRSYWALVYAGYATNLAIPFVAFAAGWPAALALFFVERLGKGLRAPARDVILAEVSEGIGRGKGFGIHELMDQIGAVAGPAIVGASIAFQGEAGAGYRFSFMVLSAPALLALLALAYAHSRYPQPQAVSVRREKGMGRLGKVFWIYLAGSSAMRAGLLYWGFIAYYLEDLASAGVLASAEIPGLYLIAMAVDAAIAFPIGVIYDRYGFSSILLAPLASIPIPLLLFALNVRPSVYLAAALLGLAMGAGETVMRAAVADLASAETRALAYGVYSSSFGASLFAGSMASALLYQAGNVEAIMALSVALEAVALTSYTLLLKVQSRGK